MCGTSPCMFWRPLRLPPWSTCRWHPPPSSPTQPPTVACKMEAQSEYAHVACTSCALLAPISHAQPVLVDRVSASELGRKSIKSALSVGSPLLSPLSPPPFPSFTRENGSKIKPPLQVEILPFFLHPSRNEAHKEKEKKKKRGRERKKKKGGGGNSCTKQGVPQKVLSLSRASWSYKQKKD